MAINVAEIGIRVYLEDQASTALGNLGGKLKSIGDIVKAGAFLGLGAAFLGFGAAIIYSVKQAAELQTALIKVQNATGLTTTQMQKLQPYMLHLTGDSIYSIQQLADGMALVAQYGFKTVPALEAVTTAGVHLGEALNTSPVIAMGLLASTMQKFNIPASQAVQTADMLFYSFEHGTPNISQLSAGLSQLGGISTTLGIKLKDIIPALDILAPNLGSAAIGGNNLYFALSRLINPTAGQAAAQKALGFSAVDLKNNFIGLEPVITELYNKLKDKTPAEQFQILTDMLTVRGAKAIEVLISHYQQYETAVAGFNKANYGAGQTTAAAQRTMDSFAGTLQALQTNIAHIAAMIGTALLPPLTALLTLLNNGAKGLMDWASANSKAAAQVLVLGAAISGAGLLGMFIALNPAMAAVLGIALLIIGVVVGLAIAIPKVVAAIQGWLKQNDTLVQWLKFLWTILVQVVLVIVGQVKSAWDEFTRQVGLLSQALNKLGIDNNTLITVLKVLAGVITGTVVVAFLILIATIGAFIIVVLKILTILTQIVTGVVTFATNVKNTFMGLITAIQGGWGTLWTWLKNFFTNTLLPGIINFFKNLALQLAGPLGGVAQVVIGAFQAIQAKLTGHSIVPDVVNSVIAWFRRLPSQLQAALAGLPGAIGSIFSQLQSRIQSALSGLPGAISSTLAPLTSTMQNSARNAMNAFTQGLRSGLNLVTVAVQPLVTLLPATINQAQAPMQQAGQNAMQATAQGVTSGGQDVTRASQDVTTKTADSWKQLGTQMQPLVQQAMQLTGQVMQMAGIAPIQSATDIAQKILQVFASTDLGQAAEKMMKTFTDGIQRAAAWAVQAAQNVVQQIANMFSHFSPPKTGPLMHDDQWMPNMMKMFAQGITSSTPLLQAAAARAAGSIASGLSAGGLVAGGTAGGRIAGGNTTVQLVVDGQLLGQVVMNRITGQMAMNGLGRAFR